MSAATCTGPTSCCASLSAANTGRSGQPMQKRGGRAGSGLPSCARDRGAPLRRWRRARRRRAPSVDVRARARRGTRRGPRAITSTVYSPAIGSRSLPCSAAWRRRRGAGSARMSCSMYSGWPSSTHQHGALAAAELRDLVGHERVGDVEHQHRQRRARRTRRPGRAAAARAPACCRGRPARSGRRRSRVPAKCSLSACSTM